MSYLTPKEEYKIFGMENPYLLKQYELHQSLEGCDVIKFTFQSVFGAEHLLQDVDAAREYLHKEIESVKGLEEKESEPLFEEISDEYVRLNLYPFIYVRGYKEDDLFNLFFKTASTQSGSNMKFDKEIMDNLETLKEDIDYKKAKSDIDEYLQSYKYQPVTHSEDYRRIEKPHYRVVNKKYLNEFLKEKEM